MWAVSALLLFQGCGGGTSSAPALTVLAAASLSEVLPDLETAYAQVHSGVDVQVSLAGSQVLATQVRYGISADVFASANAHHVEELIAEGLLEEGRVFASNELVLALSETWEGSPDLKSLTEVGSLVLGTPESPVGRYTERFLDTAGSVYGGDWLAAVRSRVVSRESNVRLAVAKVLLGEADAAVVYTTDCLGQKALRCVSLPEDLAPRVFYYQARLVHGPESDQALAWMDFVESEAGVEVLQRFGFGGPVP